MSNNYNQFISKISKSCINTWKKGNVILICGNGGSASQADHFTGEALGRFNKNRIPLPAINLSSSSGAITCIANDFGYENVFARQVSAFKDCAELLICLSTSGKSNNIIMALEEANLEGINSYLITGDNCDEKEINLICNNIYKIKSKDTADIQEKTLRVIHDIFLNVDKSF